MTVTFHMLNDANRFPTRLGVDLYAFGMNGVKIEKTAREIAPQSYSLSVFLFFDM